MAQGYKCKVMKGNTKILGMATWSYGGEELRFHEYNEFENPHVMSEATIRAGGEITLSGRFKQGDPGVALLQAAFDSGEEMTDLKLYVDAIHYWMPDPVVPKEDGSTFASYCIMTKSPKTVTFDAAGIGTIEMTMKVSGRLKEY